MSGKFLFSTPVRALYSLPPESLYGFSTMLLYTCRIAAENKRQLLGSIEFFNYITPNIIIIITIIV